VLFQFVELKGSVFKKFDKNNLFQVSCSDVRERFHLFVLLFIVVLQTMKEYSWKEGNVLVLRGDSPRKAVQWMGRSICES
jgi:hypothetical protein